MKVYIAKDWQGPKVFASPPTLSAFTDLIKLVGLNKVKELINQFMSNYKFK